MKDKIFLVLILGIVSIVLLSVFTGSSFSNGLGGISLKPKVEKFKAICDININNRLGSDPNIETINCQKKTCGFFDSLSFFSNSGQVQMVLSDTIVASGSYKVTDFGGNTMVTLDSTCLPRDKLVGSIIIRNEEGTLIDQKLVDLR